MGDIIMICDKCGEKATIRKYGYKLCYGCLNHIERLMHYKKVVNHIR